MFSRKFIRGVILGLLAAAETRKDGPQPLTDQSLYYLLHDLDYAAGGDAVREHLRYLAQAGYADLAKDYVPATEREVMRVEITGKGLKLVAGDLEEDPFIDPRGYEVTCRSGRK